MAPHFVMDQSRNEGSCQPPAKHALNAVEARFRAVVDGFGDPIIILDTYQLVRYVNMAFLDAFGYDLADVISRPFDELLPEGDRATVAAVLGGRQPGRSAALRFEHGFCRRDGRTELVATSANTLSDPSGLSTIILHMQVITARRRAEEKLRASEERYRQLVENSHDLIQSITPDGRFLFVNRTWLDTLAYAEGDLPGLTLFDIVHPDWHAVCERVLATLMSTERAGVLDMRFVTRGGKPIDVEGVAVVQLDEGRPTAFNCFLRDVSEERQHARVQAARFAVSRVLADSPALDVALAQTIEAIALNLGWHAAELWLPGGPGHELLRRDGWCADGHPELEAFVERSRDLAFRPGEGLPGRAWASGEVLWEVGLEGSTLFRRSALAVHAGIRTAVAVPIMQDQQAVGAMLFFSRDVRPPDEFLAAIFADTGRQLGQFAARKQVEAALREERASLARRVEERMADLSRVNAELARAVRAKDEFLANMSHELRTPLNTILALSELLLEQFHGPLTEEQQASLRNIDASGRHLLTLINDILDLSKVEAGRLDLDVELVAVADICQMSLMFVRELALRKRLQLTFQLNDHLAEMEADPKRLKQMLVNLLSNAVKFTPPGGTVSLEVEVQPEAGTVRFAVCDTGIGISPEDQARLFQPFTQLDSSLRRHHEGTGLGLALVWRLAELQGGSVSVESELGQGSCFTLALPASRAASQPAEPPEPAAEAPAAAPRPAAPATGTHILLAEDNESNIEVIGEYLRARGYRVAVARNGREALAAAATLQPDLVLLDIQLPELDGLEVARRLRADERFAATPILAVTALAMAGDRERCLAAGANDYMTKPVSLKGLVAAIERLLHGQGGG
jgi:PAS domain S-box-containing protein